MSSQAANQTLTIEATSSDEAIQLAAEHFGVEPERLRAEVIDKAGGGLFICLFLFMPCLLQERPIIIILWTGLTGLPGLPVL